MNVVKTSLDEVVILEPTIFGDERGFFQESYNKKAFDKVIGLNTSFVQDNHSRSKKNILRGLHYQIKQPQGKLVRVVQGSVFDVAVDLRKSSATFAQWVGVELSSENHRQLWVPPGFAHGFLVLSEQADFVYKTTDYYAPEYECSICWNDPTIGINWPECTPILSSKDEQALTLSNAKVFE